MYHSEHGQDKWLDENVFKGKRGGVAVEVGALDGIMTSNTLFLERDLGWKCVLIEANPDSFKMLKNNRTDAICVEAAVSDTDGAAVEFESFEGGLFGWSGISNSIEPQHRERIEQHIPVKNRNTVIVKTRTLNSILDELNLFDINYMSIDIEGAEPRAIAGLDLNRHKVKVLDIENNWESPMVESLLLPYGYNKIARLGVNDIYQRGE